MSGHFGFQNALPFAEEKSLDKVHSGSAFLFCARLCIVVKFWIFFLGHKFNFLKNEKITTFHLYTVQVGGEKNKNDV